MGTVETPEAQLHAKLQVFQQQKQQLADLSLQEEQNRFALSQLQALPEDAVVYQEVGVALVRCSKSEAAAHTTERLQYIKGETERTRAAYEKLARDLNEGFAALQARRKPVS